MSKGVPYKEVLELVLKHVLSRLHSAGKLSLKEMPAFSIYPSRKKKGEWLTDLACVLGRPEGKDKMELANLIISELPWLKEDNTAPCPFSDFDTYPPGFICFRI